MIRNNLKKKCFSILNFSKKCQKLSMTDEFTRNYFRYFISKMVQNHFDESDQNSSGSKLTVDSISTSTLDILTDAAIQYLIKLARETRNLAERGGRTEPNGFDVFAVLWKYRETPDTLATYIVNNPISSEFLSIKDYPMLPKGRFPENTGINSENIFPFRANAIEDIDESSLHEDDERILQFPNIPKYFPSPGEDLDEELSNQLLRRQSDREAVLASLQENKTSIEPTTEINLNCPLVDKIISSIFDT